MMRRYTRKTNQIKSLFNTKPFLYFTALKGQNMKITPEHLNSLYLKKNLSSSRAGELTLDGSIMHILFAVREDLPASKIVDETGVDAFRIASALTKLMELGLVEQIEPENKYLGKDFFAALDLNLKIAIGPMAEFLIDEAIEGAGLSKNIMSRVNGAAVVRSVASEITDTSSRQAFIRTMVQFLR